MSPSDEELMLEVKAGNADAFTPLVHRFEKRLISFFHKLTWDRQTSEDLAQEVFLRVYRARAGYEPRASFATYLFKIARHLWIDHLRNARNAKLVSLSQPSGGAEDEPALQACVEGDSPRPSAEMRRDDIKREIRVALSFLPEEQRTVFVLCEVEGLKYADVAQMLGIPVGTVKSRMHTAVSRLREKLGRKPLSGQGGSG